MKYTISNSNGKNIFEWEGGMKPAFYFFCNFMATFIVYRKTIFG
jgi:hypothetical protein